ncbi:hypothetical protein N3K66_005684 [Trichothecium roseum]|uniref:Uncharacterized protein n=1 Tax=Trichothecium roseum TaxID=47278 RepID=A0ACC0UZX0_9HYPO|nr:hypothetical protein N3K66_005684 [Trichothecium roseum]
MAADSESEPREVEEPTQDPADDAAPRRPATFAGRLKLQDFAYTSAEPRRSARIAKPVFATAAGAGAASSSSSASGSKRKAAGTAADDDGDDDNGGGGEGTKKPAKRAKKQQQRKGSGYAPPATYAHLPPLPDAVAENLLVMFIGLNPGISTARSGHAYAHPSNLFWKLLASSGVTPRRCAPEEDRVLPALYGLGFTNIVSRPSRNGGELRNAELDEGVAVLQDKARRWRPESVCIVGKSIWESIWRVRHGRPVGKDFRYGWQDRSENMGVVEGEWEGAKVFVASSTSGLAASLSTAEKERIWSELGTWVKQRRIERGE